MTVFVVQEMPNRDILSAEKYGELVPILPPGYQLILSPGPTVSKIKRVLKDFNDEDYLLLMGDPSLIGVACSTAAKINNNKYKVLKWDRERRKYYPLEININ
tara:strand:- start:2 stop:307 length:306 start_codon:yes stop_codon:yes gene_type:complete